VKTGTVKCLAMAMD